MYGCFVWIVVYFTLGLLAGYLAQDQNLERAHVTVSVVFLAIAGWTVYGFLLAVRGLYRFITKPAKPRDEDT